MSNEDESPRAVAKRLVDQFEVLSLRALRIHAVEAALNRERQIAFDQGFILAVAEIMRTHGEDVIASDVLRANRPDDWGHIDNEDMKALKPLFDHEAAVAAIRKGSNDAN
jgi:uncharacterized UPF0146 family protein